MIAFALFLSPDELPLDGEDGSLNTNDLFQRCLGSVFPVVGFNEYGFAELQVGKINGQQPYMESIWVEPERIFEVGGIFCKFAQP